MTGPLDGISVAGERRLLAVALVLLLPGCGLVVSQSAYEKDQKVIKEETQGMRQQLLVHTRTLAQHGKAINEVRFQIRDAISGVDKKVGEVQADFRDLKEEMKKMGGRRAPAARAPRKAAGPGSRQMAKGYSSGAVMMIRRTYRGLPLNYAGGYQAPRGKRFPYRLPPGTRVRVLSSDRRGFTRVEVLSGRWRKKKMWVRTIWLMAEQKSRKGSRTLSTKERS
ncbi:MAG: hypothetical protein O2807_02965 [bacterium]|nr:hypothetical protein [bacterium]